MHKLVRKLNKSVLFCRPSWIFGHNKSEYVHGSNPNVFLDPENVGLATRIMSLLSFVAKICGKTCFPENVIFGRSLPKHGHNGQSMSPYQPKRC